MPPPVGPDTCPSGTFEPHHYSSEDLAHQEVARLEDQLYDLRLRLRLEDVENYRNFNSAMVHDLREAIRKLKQDRDDEREKMSIQRSEMSKERDADQERIKSLQDENNRLRFASVQMEATRKEKVNSVLLTPPNDELEGLKVELKNMEADWESMLSKCTSQQSTIWKLLQENEEKENRIKILEDLLVGWSLKRDDRDGQRLSSSKEKEETKESCQSPRSSDERGFRMKKTLSVRPRSKNNPFDIRRGRHDYIDDSIHHEDGLKKATEEPIQGTF